MKREEVNTRFKAIMGARDPKLAEDFWTLDFREFTENEKVLMELELFAEDWHQLHEELASAFQLKKNPLAEEALYHNAFRKELDPMDYKPLARKCTWALADIGTEQSRQFLTEMAGCGDPLIEGFAQKRLDNWEKELPRKGRQLAVRSNPAGKNIQLDYYPNVIRELPNSGQQIIGYQTEDEIIVYQAFKPSIARYAVEHQQLGGADFSYGRMSWIKPNFLWMMFRCGWAEKKDQERVLAIAIKKADFEKILSQAVLSSYQSKYYDTREAWQEELQKKAVRLQWDPDHDPYGNKETRRAIQIGMKGEVLKQFGQEQIRYVEDITDFVREQKKLVDRKALDRLLIPRETIYQLQNRDLEQQLAIEK
ncbi:DUF4291 domain-containing protein [Flavilitoribacter nigricans]|nr:DUF4291 domain-containing protein [Flavilitoribacter nigricans]